MASTKIHFKLRLINGYGYCIKTHHSNPILDNGPDPDWAHCCSQLDAASIHVRASMQIHVHARYIWENRCFLQRLHKRVDVGPPTCRPAGQELVHLPVV